MENDVQKKKNRTNAGEVSENHDADSSKNKNNKYMSTVS